MCIRDRSKNILLSLERSALTFRSLLDVVCLNWIELSWIGLNWKLKLESTLKLKKWKWKLRMNRFGLNWAELNWIELNWILDVTSQHNNTISPRYCHERWSGKNKKVMRAPTSWYFLILLECSKWRGPHPVGKHVITEQKHITESKTQCVWRLVSSLMLCVWIELSWIELVRIEIEVGVDNEI